MKTSELTIDHAQKTQPWVHPYADRNRYDSMGFRSPFMVNHCFLHITKALGKIAKVLEEVDHSNVGPVPLDSDIDVIMGAVADIVSSCLKISTVYGFSLARILSKRVLEKNGVGFEGVEL